MDHKTWFRHGSTADLPKITRPSRSRSPSPDSKKRRKSKSSRQQLSCSKCKERKVKCDRTQPCSACCARGQPKECVFDCDGDFTPISQGNEIRRLRKENESLRRRLESLPQSTDLPSRDLVHPLKSEERGPLHSQRYKANQRIDNLYFGSPSLVRFVADLGEIASGALQGHDLPRESLPSVGHAVKDPFLDQHESSVLKVATKLLSNRPVIRYHLDVFHHCASTCNFPYAPDDSDQETYEKFLSNAAANGAKHPDMLAVILAKVSSGLQMAAWDEQRKIWDQNFVNRDRDVCQTYIAAAMRALQLASFMTAPTLDSLHALIIIGLCFVNSDRAQDASVLFGTTIRIAHSLGMHRDPKFLNPRPGIREEATRRNLWWLILHMDQQYSVTFGRPLGISGTGDCAFPASLIINPVELRLNDIVHHLTILARQILSHVGLLTIPKIDDFTDQLLGLWETVPEQSKFEKDWIKPEIKPTEQCLCTLSATLYAKIHSLIVMLNRQRYESTEASSNQDWRVLKETSHRTSCRNCVNRDTPNRQGRVARICPTERGRALVIESSLNVLYSFVFLGEHDSAALMCWYTVQQAFNACMVLLVDACEAANGIHIGLVQKALSFFKILDDSGIHRLAKAAVTWIRRGLGQLASAQRHGISVQALPKDSVLKHFGPILVNVQSPQPFAWDRSWSGHPLKIDQEATLCPSVSSTPGYSSSSSIYSSYPALTSTADLTMDRSSLPYLYHHKKVV